MARVVNPLFWVVGSLIVLFAIAPRAKGAIDESVRTNGWYASGHRARISLPFVMQPPASLVSPTALVADSSSANRSISTDTANNTDDTKDPNPEVKGCDEKHDQNCLPKRCKPGNSDDDKECRHHKSGDE